MKITEIKRGVTNEGKVTTAIINFDLTNEERVELVRCIEGNKNLKIWHEYDGEIYLMVKPLLNIIYENNKLDDLKQELIKLYADDNLANDVIDFGLNYIYTKRYEDLPEFLQEASEYILKQELEENEAKLLLFKDLNNRGSL